MIVGPVGPAGVAFLRISHPGVVLLVVDRRGYGPRPVEAVAHLDSGADGYLANPLVVEVASHVQALVRRAAARAA
jgi:DNA-binding response OmpR family regulator